LALFFGLPPHLVEPFPELASVQLLGFVVSVHGLARICVSVSPVNMHPFLAPQIVFFSRCLLFRFGPGGRMALFFRFGILLSPIVGSLPCLLSPLGRV